MYTMMHRSMLSAQVLPRITQAPLEYERASQRLGEEIFVMAGVARLVERPCDETVQYIRGSSISSIQNTGQEL
jgi:hypothetical protein